MASVSFMWSLAPCQKPRSDRRHVPAKVPAVATASGCMLSQLPTGRSSGVQSVHRVLVPGRGGRVKHRACTATRTDWTVAAVGLAFLVAAVAAGAREEVAPASRLARVADLSVQLLCLGSKWSLGNTTTSRTTRKLSYLHRGVARGKEKHRTLFGAARENKPTCTLM